jgi:hypothetical protein
MITARPLTPETVDAIVEHVAVPLPSYSPA